MQRLFNVMSSSVCKDSLTELMKMPFDIFYELEMYAYVDALCEAERGRNRAALTKK